MPYFCNSCTNSVKSDSRFCREFKQTLLDQRLFYTAERSKPDLFFYLCNNNVILSMFVTTRAHPFTRTYCRVGFLVQHSVGFFFAAILSLLIAVPENRSLASVLFVSPISKSPSFLKDMFFFIWNVYLLFLGLLINKFYYVLVYSTFVFDGDSQVIHVAVFE